MGAWYYINHDGERSEEGKSLTEHVRYILTCLKNVEIFRLISSVAGVDTLLLQAGGYDPNRWSPVAALREFDEPGSAVWSVVGEKELYFHTIKDVLTSFNLNPLDVSITYYFNNFNDILIKLLVHTRDCSYVIFEQNNDNRS